MIERVRGAYTGRNRSSAYRDLVWTVATAEDVSGGMEEQTRSALQIIERNLKELGAGKDSIVSAQVFIARMADKVTMDRIWCEWIGADPRNWPQRACLGVALEGATLIEVMVTAVRKSGDTNG